MTGTELRKLIAEKGFYPIPVSMPDEDSSRVPCFDGTLDEFWAATRALEAKAVFLLVLQMHESDFERDISSDNVPHDDDEGEGEEFDGENYTIDLEEALPSISKYRMYIGKDCAFVLIAKGGLTELGYRISEGWWDEFQEEATKAVEFWTEKHNERAEEVGAKLEKRKTELLSQLKTLINDREFCLLKTQRAMMGYALEKIPELEELGEYALKPEIQSLQARIEVKGLNRKSRD